MFIALLLCLSYIDRVEITELLGGRIEVKSDLGQGSVFRFFIKTAAAAPKSPLAMYVEATSLGPSPLPATTKFGATLISPNPSSQSIPTVMSAATPTTESVADLKNLHILIVEGMSRYCKSWYVLTSRQYHQSDCPQEADSESGSHL
jgi:hypothetical protein